MLHRTYTDGVIALRGQDIVFEQYFNGMTRSTLHLIMSCSKVVTSAVAGNAVQFGLLNPEALITDYLPELKGSGFEAATVQQCLDMRVGIAFDENYDDDKADWAAYELATGWRDDRNYAGPVGHLDFARTLAADNRPHGGAFHYQSILTCILGCCLERATQSNFFDLLADQVWQPMGAEQDFVSIIDANGTASFEGGFNMCLRDFARFGLLIARDGYRDDKPLIATDWLRECRRITPELTDALVAADYDDAVKEIFVVHGDDGQSIGAYHNQWWLRPEKDTIMMVTGVGGQFLLVDPARDFVGAAVSSHPEYVDSNVWMDRLRAFQAIADEVCQGS